MSAMANAAVQPPAHPEAPQQSSDLHAADAVATDNHDDDGPISATSRQPPPLLHQRHTTDAPQSSRNITGIISTTPATSRQTQQQGHDNATPGQQSTFRERAVAGAMGLGIVTAAVGGSYFLADTDVMVPIAMAACVFTVTSVLFRYALGSVYGARNRPRMRHFRHHRHFSGERAEYVRASQRLAMMDRDFTAADYEMLLDLDNHSQRLRRFLEGASEEEVGRLPLSEYKVPKSTSPVSTIKVLVEKATDEGDDINEYTGRCSLTSLQKNEIIKEENSLAGATARKCLICLEEFEDGMMIRTLPCFHRFMAECIDHWLTQQAKCPVCKKSIREDINLLSSDC